MLDYVDYTIDGDGYQGNGANPLSYDQLDGDWLTYYKVAKPFTRRVKPEDRQDFLHDLFVAFATVKASYDAKGKELTEGGLVRIAQYRVAGYWRNYYRRINGVDCGNCSKAQRLKCRSEDLYRECPRAVQIESLNKLVEDGEGNEAELYQFIADDSADFLPRLDAKFALEGFPKRFVDLAYKKYAGYRLTDSEAHYYWRERKKAQKKLVEVS